MLRRRLLAGLTLVAALLAASLRPAAPEPAAVSAIPARFTDAEFWSMVERFSEANGYFDSDNLVSNEDEYQTVIPELVRTVHPGAYLGVGPDQNFSYIIAAHPTVAFITDIRRGNLHVQLMYKALIERSADRAEFLSKLFSRARPSNLPAAGSADELLQAFSRAVPDRRLYDANLRAMLAHLTVDHGFHLADGDAEGIAAVYASFFAGGPALRFVSSRSGSWYPSYQDLQTATDGRGLNRGYLGSEELFARLKAYEQSNLIVPIVGDFAGAKAIRAVGAYLKSQGSVVSVFYTSNVERYLFQRGEWTRFIGNVAALPLDAGSTFIRSCFDSCSSTGGSRAVSMIGPIAAVVRDAQAGRITSYRDLLARSHAF
jgi:hypothetical protein